MANIDVEDVLSRLSLDDKISLLSGIDFWHTHPIPQLGIPSLRFSDGPNGVRGTRFFNGVTSACFPCGTGLAATWDQKLLLEAGRLMAKEAKAKGASVLLGPCINMQRGPLGGRGFESLSEDPVLAGLGSAALTTGIQENGISACIKHFVCNDQEHERNLVNAIVTERALREIYLKPFQIAVRDAQPSAFMTAYNKLNGTHLSENFKILKGVLRGEWGWDGLVMSDWFGTYSTSEAINAGLDIEMPGPAKFRGNILTHALKSNKTTNDTIDERARNVLNLVKRSAKAGLKENQEERTNNNSETSATLRKLASESIVLMKNEKNVLPLKKDVPVVLIGPNAKTSVFCGGGSSSMAPYYAISPFDGIQRKTKQDIKYTVGAYAHKELPLIGTHLTTSDGAAGFTFKAYNEPPNVKDREPADTLHLTDSNMFLADYSCSRLRGSLWFADLAGLFTPDEDGEYEFGLCVNGTGQLFVDGSLLIDNETTQRPGASFFGSGTTEEIGTLSMRQGQSYKIEVKFGSAPTSKLAGAGVIDFGGGGIRIGCARKISPDEEIQRAVELATADSNAQVVIVCGLNGDWEAEGHDRDDMKLPGHTDALISAVAAANSSTTVVLQCGTPVEMPWLSSISTLVQAWYGGNEAGNALADVLFGDVNPSGKLPLTFPYKLQDNPTYLNYRSEGGRTLYGEDVYIGYRYYEALDRAVAFPFGHGLSYTSFTLSDLSVTSTDPNSASKDTHISVSVSVKNTGSVAGAEVVQVYVKQQQPGIRRPVKELQGFGKVFVQPGRTETVQVVMKLKYAAGYWDEGKDMWLCEKGMYDVLVGTGSAGPGGFLEATFEVMKTFWWTGL